MAGTTGDDNCNAQIRPKNFISTIHEDCESLYDKPIFRVGGETPLISPSYTQLATPILPTSLFPRSMTDISLARVSTWNSSLANGLQRQHTDSSSSALINILFILKTGSKYGVFLDKIGGVLLGNERLGMLNKADAGYLIRASSACALLSLAYSWVPVLEPEIKTCQARWEGYKEILDQDERSFRPNAFRKMRRRAIFKNGDCNILQSRISKRRLRYLQDIFTTLVDSQWRWTLTIFAIGFLGSWLIFALIWWLIAFSHGDLQPEHLPINQAENDWAPCVLNIHGFTSCFLFSIETQYTIGYGVRTTTEECPEAIFVMCLQSIIGMIIQAFMVGIVFAKMTRPKLRTQTLQFSKNSVICQRDGQLCLMFRIGDMRKSHIIGASIRAQLIRSKRTKEGEILPNFQTEINVHADGCDGNLFFIWPMTILHKIDEESPFYYLSAGDMLQEKFEIVVILEGTIESTGQTTQARSSYLASEVLWGHRFEPVVSYNRDRQGYEVDYSKFDNTLAVDTPLCSGAELAEFYRIRDLPDTEKLPIDEFSLNSPPFPIIKTTMPGGQDKFGNQSETQNFGGPLDDDETKPFPTDNLV